MNHTKTVLSKLAKFTPQDLALIQSRRGKHNRLGFAYQLAFVKLYNRFPAQSPFEIVTELLTYVTLQLKFASDAIKQYSHRETTIWEHQDQIRRFLKLSKFSEIEAVTIERYIFDQSCRLEQTHALLACLRDFLRQQKIVEPSESTLNRLIQQERQKARDSIFEKIDSLLSNEQKQKIDELLQTDGKVYSTLHHLKQTPQRASANAIIKIAEKLDLIEKVGISSIDLSWLNNNLQRSMNRHVRKATATRIRKIKKKRRYALMVCFLKQHYQDMTDSLMKTYDKVINQMYIKTESDLDKHHRKQRKLVKKSLATFELLANTLLDESIDDAFLRTTIFNQIAKDDLTTKRNQVRDYLTGKHKDVFTLLVSNRFGYLRKFAPTLLTHLSIEKEDAKNDTLIEAVNILKQLNELGKRKLDQTTPTDFMPPAIENVVIQADGQLHKAAWECALLTTLRDHIKSGNIAIKNSKRYGHIDDFFMPKKQWDNRREPFFKRAGLPQESKDVEAFLTQKLNTAFDRFLATLSSNKYAQLDDKGWKVSKDETVGLSAEQEKELTKIKRYLSKHMRLIKLPQLLIEVDNELHFSQFFMSSSQQKKPCAEDIRAIMATVMAQGCNIGTYTMSHLIKEVSYPQMKNISDWFLTEESQRSALAILVNAISNLDITKYWGDGKTSSSDGQRFSWRKKVLEQSYSPKFNDFALEFYTFIADNYAPFFAIPKECADRDAPYVLDGLLYNESDLLLEEHYTDTGGYTEINFAAFTMLGKTFSPRIKGIQKQRIYKIDKGKDYGDLAVLLKNSKSNIRMEWITEQWDRMGHFYASLESGYVTASTVLKRLNGYTGKNHFYRANRELGRIFKTIRILNYMSDKVTRSNATKGLLKSEQLHQLTRDLKYAKRGRLTARDWLEQKVSCSCLTIILASIIYWQAKEIHRVLLECPPDLELDLSMLEHISPITWDNVILYGEIRYQKRMD
ncbi:MAG: TnpA family transposase [Paraglaciecola sp.]|jgi:TnpA family transposase